MENNLYKLNDDGIFESGYIKNTVLHRRWIMSQTFKLLNNKKGWDKAVNEDMLYQYQFKMLNEELKVQSKIHETNIEVYNERNLFFNKEVALDLCRHFQRSVIDYAVKNIRKNKYGEYIVKVNCRNEIELKDLYSTYSKEIETNIMPILFSNTPKELSHAFSKFCKWMPKTAFLDNRKNKEWKDAYKGAGAYYTLKNLIKFHDCVLKDMTQEESLKELDSLLYNDYKSETWRFHILLIEVIENNKFDFDKRMEEIYKAQEE